MDAAAGAVSFEITQADKSDLSELAEINRLAYLYETTAQIVYTNWPNQDNKGFYEARLADRLGRPGSMIYKAVEKSTGKALGFVCFTLEDAPSGAEPAKGTPTSKLLGKSIPGRNMEATLEMAGIMERLTDHMKGVKHYYLSTFAVRPELQNRGIGSLLMRHCLDIADRDNIESWLIAFPGSHSLYLRHGFTDVDHRDVDLNKYDKYRMRGYGIYRNYAMKREPQTPATAS